MKQTALIICGVLSMGALGVLAAGICGVVRAKHNRRKPVATFSALYEDNSVSIDWGRLI